MADILLIQPPIRDFYLTRKRTIPTGLAGIAAVLIPHGFTVELFDGLATNKSRVLKFPDEMACLVPYYGMPDHSPFALFHHFHHFGYSWEHIGNITKQSGAFLVGISSLFSAYHREAVRVADVVKQSLPDCSVVMGGHHATAMPDEVLKHPAVDYVLRGEGEVGMPLLARALQEGSSLQNIPGIAYREPDGSLVIHPPAAMTSLDEYPLPAIHLVKTKYYQRNKAGSISIMASRGCPMKCSYCAVGKSGLPYRRRSVASVIQEIEAAIELGPVRFIDFEDENLSLHKAWFMELLGEIISRFGKRNMELRAMNGLYPPSLDPEMMARMKTAGFRTVNLALGSASPSQLQRFSRPDVRPQLERVLECATGMGLATVCYIIAGAPDQAPEDSVDDLLYLAGKDTIAGVSIFYPAPGSPDYEKCVRLKLLPDSIALFRSTAFPVSHTTNRDQSVTILRLGRILNFMKLLMQNKEVLPSPRPYAGEVLPAGIDRIAAGRRLLAWFLGDARIRGAKPDGNVFEHRIDRQLAERFRQGVLSLLNIQSHVSIMKSGNDRNYRAGDKQ